MSVSSNQIEVDRRPQSNQLNQLAASYDDDVGHSFVSSQSLITSSIIEGGPNDLQRLQYGLNYFFMDPLKKWKRKNTKPWKLLVQVMKIVIVTIQLVLFGSNMAKFITYKDEMQTTFKQLFLKDWDPSADAIAYPGPYVPYAVYTKPDFIQALNHAIIVYSNISELSVGPFGYQSSRPETVSPIEICITSYAVAEFEPTTFSYNYSMYTSTACTTIENFSNAGSESWLDFDIRNHLKEPVNFSTLISLVAKFPLRTLLIEDATSGDAGIVCFNVDIEVFFDNRHRDGQIVIGLNSIPQRSNCQGQLTEIGTEMAMRQLLNATVLIFCLLSFTLCVRSLFRAYKLVGYTETVFRAHGVVLENKDKYEFVDFWLVMIIMNDLMIVAATVIISFYDERLLETDNYTVCSLLIGVGNLLSWSGLLRYLSFFKKYNLLIVTLRKSFIHVTRFMLCTILIYW